MNTSNDQPTRNQDEHDSVSTVELLITRLLDGEASAGDVVSFSECIQANSSVKTQLQEMREDQGIVQMNVQRELANAMRVELPLPAQTNVRDSRESSPLVSIVWKSAAVAGWAAAIALAFATLFAQSTPPPANSPARMIDREAVEPHIIQRETMNELEPLAVQTQQLPDGRWKITWMRRYLEVITSDTFEEEWIRENQVD